MLEGAPESVLRSIAHILLAKMYRKPIDCGYSTRYRKYISSHDISSKAHLLRQMRGRKRIDTPRGRVYDLNQIFDDLNARYFFGLLARPHLTWSQNHARNSLGHYDPAHNAIVVSRVPRDAAPEASSKVAREPALRALGGISGGREAVSSARTGQVVSETTVKSVEPQRADACVFLNAEFRVARREDNTNFEVMPEKRVQG
jgi:hypothetical protein